MNKIKVNRNIVTIGHVNSGKSTSISQLIYKCGTIDNRMFREFENESTKINCTVLIVSDAIGELEIGFSQNGQTHKHIQLVCALSVQQMIVAVNKMDITEPPFSE